MQVGDILRKKTTRIATVRMNETVGIAAQLMRAGNISALVVKDVVRTEGNTAAGMFTERDVVRAIAGDGPLALNRGVAGYMTKSVVTCVDGDTVDELMEVMTTGRFRHVPVLDEHQKLAGLISIGDVVKSCIAETVREANSLRDYISATA